MNAILIYKECLLKPTCATGPKFTPTPKPNIMHSLLIIFKPKLPIQERSSLFININIYITQLNKLLIIIELWWDFFFLVAILNSYISFEKNWAFKHKVIIYNDKILIKTGGLQNQRSNRTTSWFPPKTSYCNQLDK